MALKMQMLAVLLCLAHIATAKHAVLDMDDDLACSATKLIGTKLQDNFSKLFRKNKQASTTEKEDMMAEVYEVTAYCCDRCFCQRCCRIFRTRAIKLIGTVAGNLWGRVL
jgi:hypothetical protein